MIEAKKLNYNKTNNRTFIPAEPNPTDSFLYNIL